MPESNNTPPATDHVGVMARVVELLEAAARSLWERAQAEGPLGQTYTIAQDLHLAADFAAGLLPSGAERGHQAASLVGAPESAFESGSGSGIESPGSTPEDALAALTEAVSLLGSVPIEALPSGASHLLVRLADMTRQVES